MGGVHLKRLTAGALLACVAVAHQPSAMAVGPLTSGTAHVDVAPDWEAVTWESRYDQAKLAHVPLNARSSLPGQLTAIKKVEASFKSSQGQEMILSGGWEYGGYVFDNWDQLLKQLESTLGGISIRQSAFNPGNSSWQIFALTTDQQKTVRYKTGRLTLKISCELYELRLKAKIFLSAPTSIKDGNEVIQFMPSGDNTKLNIPRHGTIDPNDKRPGRTLVYLLVNPDNRTGILLQAVAPNGFFSPDRDPKKFDVVDHLGVPPDKTPLDRKLLYIFDPVVCGTAEATASDANFKMQWP